MREITTKDGYTLRVFSSMYIDWGLEILKDGEEVYYSPHCLSSENYGSSPVDEDEDEWEEWTDEEWRECLRNEADELIEAFTPMEEDE